MLTFKLDFKAVYKLFFIIVYTRHQYIDTNIIFSNILGRELVKYVKEKK